MITISGLRNAFWSAVAFIIVACATAPMSADEQAAGNAQAVDSVAPTGSVRT
jgi:hypothetical protein